MAGGQSQRERNNTRRATNHHHVQLCSQEGEGWISPRMHPSPPERTPDKNAQEFDATRWFMVTTWPPRTRMQDDFRHYITPRTVTNQDARDLQSRWNPSPHRSPEIASAVSDEKRLHLYAVATPPSMLAPSPSHLLSIRSAALPNRRRRCGVPWLALEEHEVPVL